MDKRCKGVNKARWLALIGGLGEMNRVVYSTKAVNIKWDY